MEIFLDKNHQKFLSYEKIYVGKTITWKKYLPFQTLNLKLPDYVVITGTENPLDHLSDFDINVSPNPANTELNVTINNAVRGDIHIDIYTATGKCVSSKMSNNSSQNIDVSGLKQWIYFLKIKNDKFVKTEKIVIA